jgi:WD40 repeat protein
MITTSYDNKCKIWGTKSIIQGENTADEWALLRTLSGHENKVTSVVATEDLSTVITTSFDRTFKVWKKLIK